MKIISVETFELRHSLEQPYGVACAYGHERSTFLVKITSDDGTAGWGETAPAFPFLTAMVERQFRPMLLGQDPRHFRRLWERLWGPNFGNGFAVGAVSTALLDLRGKLLGVSIAEQFGGPMRDRVLAYASGMSYAPGVDPADKNPAEARALAARGFRAMKMRIGGRAFEDDLAGAEGVRAAVGPDVLLLADGNGGYTLSSALRMGRELERLGFFWFEEPLPQVNGHYSGYEALRTKLNIALAGGEGTNSRPTAHALLNRGCFDLIQPDLTICGGVSECLFIGELARLHGVRLAPHCFGGAISLAATLHVLALLPEPDLSLTPEPLMLELDVNENPFRDRIVKNAGTLAMGPDGMLTDGCVEIPTGPGLGIEIDESALDAYRTR